SARTCGCGTAQARCSTRASGCARWSSCGGRPACSVGLPLLDRALLGLALLHDAPAGEALVAEHAHALDLGPLAAAAAVLDDLELARAGLAVFVLGLHLGWLGPPQHQQLADVLYGRGAEGVAQLLVHRLAGFTVVAEHADLDQAVGVERR